MVKTIQRKDISDVQVCEHVRRFRNNKSPWEQYHWPYETLSEEFGCHWKVAYAACERAYENGYLEYGVSLRTAWLTDKGKNLLDSQVTA